MFEIYTFFENTTEIFFENRTEIYTFFEKGLKFILAFCLKIGPKISNILSMVDGLSIKLQLKQAKAKVVVNIFDTDTISKPLHFLRHFWAATGVPKTKPITDVVADNLASTPKMAGWRSTTTSPNWRLADGASDTHPPSGHGHPNL